LIFERARYVFVGRPFSAIPLFPRANQQFHFYVFFLILATTLNLLNNFSI
jgi:hypothetical protein